jgi:hypothetical protein
MEELVEARETPLECLLREVAKCLGHKLPVLIEVLNALRDNRDLYTVHIDFPLLLLTGRDVDVGWDDHHLVISRLTWQRLLAFLGQWRSLGWD